MVIGRRIRCLLFDLGSTLWTRQEEGTLRAKEHTYAMVGNMLHCALGGTIFSSLDAQALGHQVHKSLEKRIHQEKEQRPGYEPDFVIITTEILRQFGLAEADNTLGASIFEALRVRVPVSRVLFADTLSTLSALKQRGYLLGVVTNRNYGGPLFREDLQVMGLLDYFEYQYMAISADLGIRKPNPDIFNYALTGLNALPEETAMVGDNLKADVGGAKDMNMLGIWKPKPSQRGEKHHKIKPDMTIEHLSDLLEIF